MSIRSQLTNPELKLTRSELRIVGVLLDNYPVAGLTTAANLADKAAASYPTVIRLANKLGYDSFTSFQKALFAEQEASHMSPLSMLAQYKDVDAQGDLFLSYTQFASGHLERIRQSHIPNSFAAALDMICDHRKRILCLGGRFSRYLAAYLRAHLVQLRSGTECLEGSASDYVDRLVDIDSRDVIILFDYRRYQKDIISFALSAKERRAQIILFTDIWQSPIVSVANVTIIAPVDTLSPFDSLIAPLTQVEALVAAATARLQDRSRSRIADLEMLRESNQITIA